LGALPEYFSALRKASTGKKCECRSTFIIASHHEVIVVNKMLTVKRFDARGSCSDTNIPDKLIGLPMKFDTSS
jgi:hypothetical protein